MIQGQPGQIILKTPAQPTAGHSGMYLSFQAEQEAEIRRTEVLGQ
jgi:hypothetical protein